MLERDLCSPIKWDDCPLFFVLGDDGVGGWVRGGMTGKLVLVLRVNP